MSSSLGIAGLVPDQIFRKMMPRTSVAFRRLCRVVQEELRDGDAQKAHAFVRELIARKPMGPSDRRCMVALQTALRAIVNLRAAGLPRGLDLEHTLGDSYTVRLNERLVTILQDNLRRQVDDRASTSEPCPNCGSPGAPIGRVTLIDNSPVPHGQFYFDPEQSVATALPGESIDQIYANILVTAALRRMGARAPVLACGICHLRYIGWRRDADLGRHYNEPIGIGFDLLGRRAFGRAHKFAWSYQQTALPLHVERIIGDVKGLRVYDFGCADGVMAAMFDDLGADVCGSDLDVPKIYYGQMALELSDLSDKAEYFWDIPDKSLDILYAFHSLEHVFSTDAFFDKFAQAVKPGGALVISVPHIRRDAEGEVAHMGGSHLVGFETDVLAGFFSRHGFEIIDCRADTGAVAAEEIDPIFGMPAWSGKRGDLTIIGRRSG